MTRAADALAVLLDDGAWTPPPAKPAPAPQHFAHADVVRRSIGGDDEATNARRPGRVGFFDGLAASMDSGAPMRSSSDPDRFGKGAMRGSSGRPIDTNTERERYYFAARAIRQRIDALPEAWTRTGQPITGELRFRTWVTLRGPGRLVMRDMHEKNAERYRKQLEARAKKIAAGKNPAKLAEPPKPPRAVMVPERRKDKTARDVSDFLRAGGIDLSPKEVRTICKQIDELVDEENEKRGCVWYRPRARRAETNGAIIMATSDYVNGWGEIASYLGISVRTAQKLEGSGLPVRTGLAGGVSAKKSELDEYQERARALRASSKPAA